MQKLVSIIIPCYNVEKYIKECLNSVVTQTYNNLEIICVNDGSTDSTLAILNDIKESDSRIKIIDQENSKLGAARKSGFDASNGELIINLDSDDTFYSNDSVMTMIKHHKNSDDVSSFTFRPNYEEKRNFIKYSIFNRIRFWVPFTKKLRLYNWYMWAKVFNRDFYSKCSFNKLNKGEDKKFIFDNETKKYSIYNIPVIKYRVRANSIMAKEEAPDGNNS